jgi:hypothetical protein
LKNITKNILIFFLITAVYSCGKSKENLPEEFTGNWSNTIQIEGTDGVVENQIHISTDTIILKQSFPRMSGIDKIKSTYIANRIENDNDSTYSFYTSTDNVKSRIVIEKLSSAQLKISICQLNGQDNKDAQFTTCTDWGLFSK